MREGETHGGLAPRQRREPRRTPALRRQASLGMAGIHLETARTRPAPPGHSRRRRRAKDREEKNAHRQPGNASAISPGRISSVPPDREPGRFAVRSFRLPHDSGGTDEIPPSPHLSVICRSRPSSAGEAARNGLRALSTLNPQPSIPFKAPPSSPGRLHCPGELSYVVLLSQRNPGVS
jgi:hypothetical protein